MPELKFNKGTDTEHEAELESHLISALWTPGCAFAGHPTRFEVNTALVGAGAKIKVTGKSEKGEKLGKVSGEIRNNTFVDEFDVPEDLEPGDKIYFEVELPDNSLAGESNRIPVLLLPRIKSIGWSATEARRGDILTLSAEVENIRDETEVKLVIYEYDQDGAHDRVTELLTKVMNARVELEWEYEYHEDTDEIPTEEERQKYGGSYKPPEYFFTIKIEDLELGREQESGLLEFKDWVRIRLTNGVSQPLADEPYVLYLADGNTIEGQTDTEGVIEVRPAPPGRSLVEFPAYFEIAVMEGGKQISGLERGKPRRPGIDGAPPADQNDTDEEDVLDGELTYDQVYGEPSKEDEDEDIDEEEDDDEDEEDEEDEVEQTDEDSDEVSDDDSSGADAGQETSSDSRPVDPELEYVPDEGCEPNEFAIAGRYQATGREAHMAVLTCIAVELVRPDGTPVTDTVTYEIRDSSNQLIATGECNDSVIFHDRVGLDDYELKIGETTFTVPSGYHADDPHILVLKVEQSASGNREQGG